ncbi:DNA replication protein DnaC [Arthrobacter sp. UYEF6]
MPVAVEWLGMTSDTLLAQSAIDRLTQGAHTLVIEGPSWRQRASENRRATLDENKETHNAK